MKKLLAVTPLLFLACVHAGQINLKDLAIDCTTKAADQLIAEFTPVVSTMLANARGVDGSIDKDKVTSSFKSLGVSTGACVVADLVSQLSEKRGLVGSDMELFALFSKIRADAWGGAIFKTKHGLL